MTRVHVLPYLNGKPCKMHDKKDWKNTVHEDVVMWHELYTSIKLIRNAEIDIAI